MSELDVSDVVKSLGQTTRLRIIKKSVVNFGLAEAEQAPQVPLWFDVVLQSMHPKMLLIKPEGQRHWKWWTMWSTEKLELDWVMQDPNQLKLRVMSRADWSQAGYFEYTLVEGPTP